MIHYIYIYFPCSTNNNPWSESLNGWVLKAFYLSFFPTPLDNEFSLVGT